MDIISVLKGPDKSVYKMSDDKAWPPWLSSDLRMVPKNAAMSSYSSLR